MCLVELFLEFLKLKQGALPTAFLFRRRASWREWGGSLGRFWAEPNPADVEVLLEAVQLEEVG